MKEQDAVPWNEKTIQGVGFSPGASAARDAKRAAIGVNMDLTTILIVVLLVLLLGGGGWYGRGRWYGR